MLDAAYWLVTNIGMGVVNLVRAIMTLPGSLNLADPAARINVIYYGASVEFFFILFDLFLVVLVAGLIRRPFLWGVVRMLEGFSNGLGRLIAWAGLIMVIQQVMVIFLQRFFRVADITISPFGYPFTQSLGWFGDELKLYNAAIVALACAYTFAQGGHVRVDLVYARLSHRAKRVVDMVGALLFMVPMMTITWLFGWFYLWRHLATPPINATDTLEAMTRKAQILRWNVQTTSFSPSGFNGYFLFKVLLILLAATVLIHAVSYFYRCLLEYIEGEASADKYADRDVLEDTGAEPTASEQVG
ncbi:MAG: TRAP transporter small permease subunit [Paracoccaceae bacterium]|nr:TRAP transporter small permease subunit [Paracoccaceae bacterium]